MVNCVKKAYENLQNKGFIYHGSIIPQKEIEEAFEATSEKLQYCLLDCWAFFEERGYPLTQAGLDEFSFRILHVREMAPKMNKSFNTKVNQIDRKARSLLACNTSELDETAKDVHFKTQFRLARSVQAIQTAEMQNQSFDNAKVIYAQAH